jgi:sulfur carrier protein
LTLQVRVNGRDEPITPGATIASLLDGHGLRSEWVVVERNGDPVLRARFGEVELTEGDRVEIVRAVAGGAM